MYNNTHNIRERPVHPKCYAATSTPPLPLWRALCSRLPWSRQTVIHPQLASVQLLPLQVLHSPHRAVDIDEVCVRETTWLASAAINGYPHINDVAHFAEEVAQVLVGHLEGHVANEEGLGWGIRATELAAVDGLAGTVELDG